MNARDKLIDAACQAAADEIVRLRAELERLVPYAAAGRWVLDNSNAYDRHMNAHVAGAWHVYEEASGRNPVAETPLAAGESAVAEVRDAQ